VLLLLFVEIHLVLFVPLSACACASLLPLSLSVLARVFPMMIVLLCLRRYEPELRDHQLRLILRVVLATLLVVNLLLILSKCLLDVRLALSLADRFFLEKVLPLFVIGCD
jgi:hypothetical protein